MTEFKRVEFTDSLGKPRRVLLPDNGVDYPPSEGIVVDMYDDLDALYNHVPVEWNVRLAQELKRRDLVEPEDFLAPDAPTRFRSAMLTVIKHDAMNAIAIAKERMDNGQPT